MRTAPESSGCASAPAAPLLEDSAPLNTATVGARRLLDFGQRMRQGTRKASCTHSVASTKNNVKSFSLINKYCIFYCCLSCQPSANLPHRTAYLHFFLVLFHSACVFTTAILVSQSVLLPLQLSSQAKTTELVQHSFASVAPGEVCSSQGWDAPLWKGRNNFRSLRTGKNPCINHEVKFYLPLLPICRNRKEAPQMAGSCVGF